MRSILTKIGLLLLAATTAVVLSGCEEALTDSNTEGIPNTAGADSTADQPFITIVSGSQTNPVIGTASRSDDPTTEALFGSNTVSAEVEPNFALQEDINFEFETSGSAVAGEDYTIPSSGSGTIVYDSTNTSLDDTTIDVVGGGGGLATETRSVEVSLTSAQTASGDEVLVGRGGSDVGTSAIVEIAPAIGLLNSSFAVLSEVDAPDTAVGEEATVNLFLFNASGEEFDAENFSIVGEDASEFSVTSTVTNPVGAGSITTPSAEPVGESTALLVEFAPTSEGDKSATLEFDVSNADNSVTAQFSVSATAVPAN
jgi:hypothetical protein